MPAQCVYHNVPLAWNELWAGAPLTCCWSSSNPRRIAPSSLKLMETRALPGFQMPDVCRCAVVAPHPTLEVSVNITNSGCWKDRSLPCDRLLLLLHKEGSASSPVTLELGGAWSRSPSSNPGSGPIGVLSPSYCLLIPAGTARTDGPRAEAIKWLEERHGL